MDHSKELQRIQACIERLREHNRSLSPLLNAFAPLFGELAHMRSALLAAGLAAVRADEDTLARGAPLFVDAPMADLAQAFLAASRKIVPAMATAFPGVSDDLRKAMYALESDALDPAPLMEAAIAGDEAGIGKLAKASGLAAATTALVADFVLRPVLQVAGRGVLEDLDLGSWGRGYCPLCGAPPAMAILRRSGDDDAFLKSHGGQRWLSCSRCASQWRYKRHACPACGNEEHESLEYFHLEGGRRERADLCKVCGHYLVTFDATQTLEEPVADVTALGLLPLDILMQREGYRPVADTVFNRLEA